MIYEYLEQVGAIGAENAIRKADLAAQLGMTEEDVKRQVNFERQQQSLLVCSGTCGYFLPKDREEIAEFAAKEDAVAESHRLTAKPFHEALKAQEGQLEVFTGDSDGEKETTV